MNNKTFVMVTGGIAAILLLAFLFWPKPIVQEKAPPVSASESFELIRPHSPTFGPALARVTVVQWFDPECESCRMVHPEFKKMMNDYRENVRFVLRYMPYHPGSMFAASALQEAHELGKFEAAVDILFEMQPEWGDHHEPKPHLIPKYLVSVGIPAEKLEQEYLFSKHKKSIELDQADGNQAGVRGTPTFFVNGRMVEELNIELIRQRIDEALGKPTR